MSYVFKGIFVNVLGVIDMFDTLINWGEGGEA